MRIKVVRREDQDSTLLVLRQSMPGWKDLAITEKSKTAVTTQDCIDTVKEVPGAIGFGPFTQGARDGARGAQDRRPPSDRPRLSERRDLVVRAQGNDRHARRQALHRLCEGREGADRSSPAWAAFRSSSEDVTAEVRGLASPFFAQYPADHRGRCDRDGRVRGLVRPDHRSARSGPRAAGRAARAGSRRRSSASASTAKRGSPARGRRAVLQPRPRGWRASRSAPTS